MNKRDDGITLVEVLVTLLIIGILSGIVMLNLGNSRTASVQNACTTNYQALLLAISTYQSDNNGALPANIAALSPIYINPGLVTTDAFSLTLAASGSSYVIKVNNKAGTVLGDAPAACTALT
jgi:prepilin-type N-terminal cleavage/methylation domain-containing protein